MKDEKKIIARNRAAQKRAARNHNKTFKPGREAWPMIARKADSRTGGLAEGKNNGKTDR